VWHPSHSEALPERHTTLRGTQPQRTGQPTHHPDTGVATPTVAKPRPNATHDVAWNLAVPNGHGVAWEPSDSETVPEGHTALCANQAAAGQPTHHPDTGVATPATAKRCPIGTRRGVEPSCSEAVPNGHGVAWEPSGGELGPEPHCTVTVFPQDQQATVRKSTVLVLGFSPYRRPVVTARLGAPLT
jgi:hypothetical protein